MKARTVNAADSGADTRRVTPYDRTCLAAITGLDVRTVCRVYTPGHRADRNTLALVANAARLLKLPLPPQAANRPFFDVTQLVIEARSTRAQRGDR